VKGWGLCARFAHRKLCEGRRSVTGLKEDSMMNPHQGLGELLAFHATGGCSNGRTAGWSNGPTEAVNLLIKKVKRVGSGFGNVTNDRLRLLLGTAAGGALTLANCRA
jgi:hypothetical protein